VVVGEVGVGLGGGGRRRRNKWQHGTHKMLVRK